MKYNINSKYMSNQNKSNKIKKQTKPLSPSNKQKKLKVNKKINSKIKAHNLRTNSKKTKAELKTELETRLNDRGVEFRSDSALCAKYINGNTDLSLDYIVQRMCEMKYLYENCDMKLIRAQVYMDYINSGYIKDYEGTIATQAEKIALQTHSNGTYPDKFPWENNKIDDKKISLSFILMFILGYFLCLSPLYILEYYKTYWKNF